jgi:hypothetical protein
MEGKQIPTEGAPLQLVVDERRFVLPENIDKKLKGTCLYARVCSLLESLGKK